MRTQLPKTSLLWIPEGVEYMITVNGSKRDKAELQEGQRETNTPQALTSL